LTLDYQDQNATVPTALAFLELDPSSQMYNPNLFIEIHTGLCTL